MEAPLRYVPFWKLLSSLIRFSSGAERPQPASMPRHIPALHDPLVHNLRQAVAEMSKDPRITAAWRHAQALLCRPFLDTAGGASDPVWLQEFDQTYDAFWACLAELTALVQKRAPVLVRYFGPFLEDNLLDALYITLELPAPVRGAVCLYRPDLNSPVTFPPDGSIAGLQEATPLQRKHVLLYLQSRDSYVPAGPQLGSTSRPPDFIDQVRAAFHTLHNAGHAKLSIGRLDIMHELHMQESELRKFERWLKECTGKTWKQFRATL